MSPDLTPKRQRKSAEERRDDILGAASKVFAEHGFRCADVQQIADLAGIGKGTIYRFYATKDELFRATVDDGMQRLTTRVDKSIEHLADPLDKLRVGFKTYMDFFDQYPEIIELFVHERAELRATGKPLYFVYSEARQQAWLDICQQLIDSGRCRIEDPAQILYALGNLGYGTLLVNRISGREGTLAGAADGLLDVFLHGILEMR